MKWKKSLALVLTTLLTLSLLAGVVSADSPSNGLVVNKSVSSTPDQNGAYTVTLEAYATGSETTITGQEYPPLNIVIALDVSEDMENYVIVADKEKSLDSIDTIYGANKNDPTTVVYELNDRLSLSDLISGSYNEPVWRRMKYDNNNWYYRAWTYTIDWKSGTLEITDRDRDPWLKPNSSDNTSTSTEIRVKKIDAEKIAAMKFLNSILEQNAEKNVNYTVSVVKYGGTINEATGDNKYGNNQNYSQIVVEPTVLNASTIQTFKDAIYSTTVLTSGGDANIANGLERAQAALDKMPQDTASSLAAKDYGVLISGGTISGCTASDALSAADALKTTSGATIYTVNFSDSKQTESALLQQIASSSDSYTQTVQSSDLDAHLSGLFEKITTSSTSGGADNKNLTSNLVLSDTVSKYFTIVDGSISAHTETYTLDNTWTRGTDISSVSLNDSTVSATGFDYSANWVGTKTADETTTAHGSKLVVTYQIKPKTRFLGGNGVVIDEAPSGVYTAQSQQIAAFPSKTVDVAIPDLTVTVPKQNVYLLGGVPADTMTAAATVKNGETTVDDSLTWEDDYVTISKTATGTSGMTEDGSYTVTCTVTPTATGGTISAKSFTSDSAAINVFKPTLSFDDCTVYYGGADPEIKPKSTVWKHGDTASSAVTMIGNEPNLDLTYSQTTGFTDCTTVSLDSVKINNEDVKNHVTDASFMVHVVKPSFTTSDVTIYRCNSTDLNDRVGVNSDWGCDHNKTLSKKDAPAITYSFANGTSSISTTIASAYSPVDCAAITATATVGSSTTTLPVPGFTVHVLQPTLTLGVQDVWVDYGANFDLAEKCITEPANSLTWADKNSSHSVSVSNAEGTAPTVKSKTFTFDPNTGITDGKYTVGEADATFSVEAKFTLSNSNNTSFAAKFTDNKDKDTFTVHVNKFNLTVSHDGTQNAIFTLNDVTKLAVPAGKSVTVHGLICGKDYSISEANDNAWTWRYDAAATGTITGTTSHNEVSTTDPGTGTASVEMKYGNQTNTLWLSGQAYAINRATTGLVDALPTPSQSTSKKKEG